MVVYSCYRWTLLVSCCVRTEDDIDTYHKCEAGSHVMLHLCTMTVNKNCECPLYSARAYQHEVVIVDIRSEEADVGF